MYETSKAILRRLHDSRFATRYLVGHGIDIGSGSDPLNRYAELFPLMDSCRDWDLKDGDAQSLGTLADDSLDFVHSSHCLEHMHDPREALHHWLRVLKPGGHLIFTVPDEDLYEQGVFPSTWNNDHKWTFTMHKVQSWSGKSLNILTLLTELSECAQVIKVEQLDATYRFEPQARFDQTRTLIGECALEIILRKLTPDDRARGGRFPDSASVPEPVQSLPEALATALRHHNEGRFSDAEALYRKVLATEQDSAEIHKNLGNTLMCLGRSEEAEQAYRQALSLKPDYAEAHNNLGNVLRLGGRVEEAEQSFRRALALMPESAEVLNNFGNVLMDTERTEEAEQTYRKSIVLKPDYAVAYNNRGNALMALGRSQIAEKVYRRAIDLKPDYAEAYIGLGNVLVQSGRVSEAEQAYLLALTLKPDHAMGQFNLSLLYLLQGRFEDGLRLHEQRIDGGGASSFRTTREQLKALQGHRRWQGEPLDGKALLIITEQGAGDTLMMMRYLPLLKRSSLKRLVVWCGPNLARVFQSIPAVDDADSKIDPSATGRIDFYCPMMSLPYLFRTRMESIPASVPYLNVPDEMKKGWRALLEEATGLKVGLAWAGNRRHSQNSNRSIPLSKFSPLASIVGVRLVSLQKGEDAEQLRDLGWDFLDWMDACDDFLDTAALVAELDLVISVDTAVAHLAGALGKPVWLLNRFESEWRWMLDREDSPWYPSMRIFRQKESGDWDSVIMQVAEELGKLTGSRVGLLPDSDEVRAKRCEALSKQGNALLGQGRLAST